MPRTKFKIKKENEVIAADVIKGMKMISRKGEIYKIINIIRQSTRDDVVKMEGPWDNSFSVPMRELLGDMNNGYLVAK